MKTIVLFPQRRMVAHYRALAARYMRVAEVAASNESVREFALSRACDYAEDARIEERAILRSMQS